MDRGTYLEHDGRPAVRFQRIYPHAIERVWAAVTEPTELAHWFPSTVKIELRPGGTIEFFDDPHTGPTTGTRRHQTHARQGFGGCCGSSRHWSADVLGSSARTWAMSKDAAGLSGPSVRQASAIRPCSAGAAIAMMCS